MSLLTRVIAALIAAPIAVIAAPTDYAFLEDEAEGEFSVRATLTTPAQWPAAATAELAFHHQDEANYLVARLSGRGFGFFRARNGKETKWGDLVDWKPPTGKPLQITLQRRDCHIALAVDGTVVARAYEHQMSGGRVGTRASAAALQWEEVSLQPLEPVHFSDDFTRAAGQEGEWETLARQVAIQAGVKVEDLGFASPNIAYLRSGFGGNKWGAAFHVDDFRLLGSDQTVPADAKSAVMRVPTAGTPHFALESGPGRLGYALRGSFGSAASPAWADYDGDGDLDFLANNLATGRAWLVRNDLKMTSQQAALEVDLSKATCPLGALWVAARESPSGSAVQRRDGDEEECGGRSA